VDFDARRQADKALAIIPYFDATEITALN